MKAFLDGLLALGSIRLAMLGATALILVGAVLGLSFFAGGPAPVVLYSNLNLSDSASAVSVLAANHISYSLSDGGQTILVPASSLDTARLALAAKNLPSGGASSYALFDSSSALTDSDFLDHINETRALNGELEQTIEQMQGIAQARVNIVLPHQEPFAQNPDPAQASVLLTLSGPAPLDQTSVNAILNLVASAVPALKPQNISIADNRGDLLAEPGSPAGPLSQDTTTTDLEKMTGLQMSQAVEAMLDQALGPGHVHVVATVAMNFDNLDQTQTVYDPNGQVAISQQNATTKSTTSQPQQTVSVQNNLPNPPSAANPPTSSSDQQTQTTNFDVSATVKHLMQNAPQISRISVAVLLDGISTANAKGKLSWGPRSASQIAAITNLVKGAVGYDASRGDVVDVETIPFFGDSEAAAIVVSPLQRLVGGSDVIFLIKLAVLCGATLIALMTVAKPVMMKIATASELAGPGGNMRMLGSAPFGAERAKIMATNSAALTDDSQNADAPPSALEAMLQTANSPASQIAALVKSNPRESLATIRSWLTQEQDA
jgi:flagellar M-ring protein FliF